MPALDATRRRSPEASQFFSSTLFVIFLRQADRENFVNFPKYFQGVSFVIDARTVLFRQAGRHPIAKPDLWPAAFRLHGCFTAMSSALAVRYFEECRLETCIRA
jgi:hypothetical protein